MKRLTAAIVLLFCACLAFPAYSQDVIVGPGVKLKTPNGVINKKAGTIVFPDGTITFSGNIATLDLSSLGGGDMSTTTWTSGGYLATAKGGLGFDASSLGVGSAEFGYLNGVTSAIQTQLDGKQAANANLTTAAGVTGNSKYFGTNSGGTVGIYDLPAGTWAGLSSGTNTTGAFLVGTGASLGYTGTGTIDASAYQGQSTTTGTELGYVHGVTGAIQTQIDGKAASSHNHAGSAITSGTVGATYLPSNSDSSAGIVTSGAAQVNKVWKTDADGVPSWRDDSTGGTPTFDTVGSGTNVSSTMTVGAGGTLTYSTTGIVNASRFQGVTSVDATEFGYLDGVTSAIQTQLNAKAPSNATYLTTTSESGLSAEANLGALTTGLVKITVTGGVATPSTAASGTDYAPPTSSTTTQLNYLNAATGTTGTTNTNLVFSTSPTLTTPTFSGATMADGTNIVLNTTTGTKIGTGTTQKLAFYNSTPIAQPTGSALTALSNLGLVSSPTIAMTELSTFSSANLYGRLTDETGSASGTPLAVFNQNPTIAGVTGTGAWNLGGASGVTLPTGLTGVLRADSGVVSTDSDVTDIVAAGTTSAAGKLQLATTAEAVTGTDTAKAVTAAGLTSRLAAPGAIGGTTPAAGTFTSLSAGAGGFSVDADGDTTAKTLTVTGASGSPGYARVLEDPAYGTNYRGWSMTAATDYTTSWTVNWPGGDPTANQFVFLHAPSSNVIAATYGSFGTEFTVSANTVNLTTGGIGISKINATGTPSGSTALYGDGSWKPVTAAASGSDGYLQFASSGALSSDAGLAFNATTQRLTIGKNGTTGGLFLLAETGSTDRTSLIRPSTSMSVDVDTIWFPSNLVAGDTVIASSNNQLGVVAKGSPYQIFGMNSGATAPAWTSTLGATGTRLTAGYFTDLTVTNAISGSITGNAGTVTVADAADDTTTWPMLATSATGSLAPATDSSLTYNSSSGLLSTTALTLGGTLTLQNAETITNADDTEIAFNGTESIALDLDTGTANQVQWKNKTTSGTGVTEMNFSALNMVTTGYIQGGINVSSDADGMDAAAMTAAGMYGTLFVATGAGTWILPRAALGMSACLMDSGTAHDLILDVTAGSTIRLKGTEQADGVGITNASGSTTGDFICVVAVATDKWSTMGMQGTWVSQ